MQLLAYLAELTV